ncbi:hypothetical protein C1645_820523 [Glomus cerebriforme]|uniref:Uncharacterized protein n=1 Tax=Glomus cerebriforme TaxID=658196 RepID=A0A397TCH0_9GLOM|nr:hypothetical protein C1645_820523 [Glomus cerebriforme]
MSLKAFSYEREVKWKTRLAELAKNPRLLKKSHNFFTSKRLDYSKQLLETRNVKINDKLESKDVEMKKNDEDEVSYSNQGGYGGGYPPQQYSGYTEAY